MEEIEVTEAPQLSLQEQFDTLVAHKMKLWDAIKHLDAYYETDEWSEIEDIDAEMWRVKNLMEEAE